VIPFISRFPSRRIGLVNGRSGTTKDSFNLPARAQDLLIFLVARDISSALFITLLTVLTAGSLGGNPLQSARPVYPYPDVRRPLPNPAQDPFLHSPRHRAADLRGKFAGHFPWVWPLGLGDAARTAALHRSCHPGRLRRAGVHGTVEDGGAHLVLRGPAGERLCPTRVGRAL
jgi:hypothetical protein